MNASYIASMSSSIQQIIDKKLLRIIQLFLKKENELFHLQKISSEADVPIGSCFRLIKKLVAIGLVNIVQVGKIKLYKTNKKVAKEFKILE